MTDVHGKKGNNTFPNDDTFIFKIAILAKLESCNEKIFTEQCHDLFI